MSCELGNKCTVNYEKEVVKYEKSNVIAHKSPFTPIKSPAFVKQSIKAEKDSTIAIRSNVISKNSSVVPASKEMETPVQIKRSTEILSQMKPKISQLNCYINSVFQALSSSSNLFHNIEELNCKMNKEGTYQNIFSFLELLQKFKSEIFMKSVFDNLLFKEWTKSGEQDCFELILFLLTQIYCDLRFYMEQRGIVKNDADWIQQSVPMRIVLQYRYSCHGCDFPPSVVHKAEVAMHLPVSRKGTSVLQSMVDQYLADEEVQGYECTCASGMATRSMILVEPLPRTLCVHLQRSYWTGCGMRKIESRVNFTEELSIKGAFILDTSSKSEESAEQDSSAEELGDTAMIKERPINKVKAEESSEVEEDDFEMIDDNDYENDDLGFVKLDYVKSRDVSMHSVESLITEEHCEMLPDFLEESSSHYVPVTTVTRPDALYRLVAVIEHIGNVRSGHYVCYKKLGGRWFLTNDDSIEQVSLEDVLARCEAYILLYDLVD